MSYTGGLMTYVQDHIVHDADSHVMELSDWIIEYADPDIRDRIRPLDLGRAGKFAAEAVADAEARRGDEEAARRLEDQLLTAKGWMALGAFDPAERSRALDLLGFSSQLVFSTFAALQFAGDDQELTMGGSRALNRALADFCCDDDRLVAVGQALWIGPDDTLSLVTEALEEGCGAILFPSDPGRHGISPTHADYDPVWALLEERDIPFMLHIGGGGRPVRRPFHDNGRPVTDFLGGGENVRSKDYMALNQLPEQFLSAMVLDGVFQDHPGLRGGCIEQGAMWVPSWLRRLDSVIRTFSRTEPALAGLEMKPSDYVHRQLWFTPFAGEDVGWLIDQCGDDLFLFSSDYPHPEGGRDPVARFEETMGDVGDTARTRFYETNYAEMLAL